MKQSSIFQVKCPYCNALAEFEEIRPYHSHWDERIENRTRYRYVCKPCDAYVWADGSSQKPWGTLADKKLRSWRKETRDLITEIVDKNYKTQNQVYHGLQYKLGLAPQECKIGLFDIQVCQDAIQILHDYLNSKNQEAAQNLEKLM